MGGIFLTDSLKQVVTIDTVSIQEVTMELTLNGRVTFNQEQVARVYPIFGGDGDGSPCGNGRLCAKR